MKIQKTGEMTDITCEEDDGALDLIVSADRRRVWLNSETGCLIRVCRISELRLIIEPKPSQVARHEQSAVRLSDQEHQHNQVDDPTHKQIKHPSLDYPGKKGNPSNT